MVGAVAVKFALLVKQYANSYAFIGPLPSSPSRPERGSAKDLIERSSTRRLRKRLRLRRTLADCGQLKHLSEHEHEQGPIAGSRRLSADTFQQSPASKHP